MNVNDNGSGAGAEPVELSVVIPCKNEEARIAATLDTVIAAIAQLNCRCEVLVIDDGSTDRTGEVVGEYMRAHPGLPVRLHANPRNLGLSRSYVDGAFLTRGKYYRLVCGDNVEPGETMLSIFRRMGAADIIIPYYASVPGKSATRLAVSNLFTSLVNWFSGNSIRYYNGGAMHLRQNVLRWHSYSFGFGFQADFITRLIDEGAGYLEVCVEARHTVKERGGSPFTVRNFVSTGHTLFEILRRRINRRLFDAR